ncbi:MAG: sigma-54-dependent transcriptional regulator [Opitutales bacterium]
MPASILIVDDEKHTRDGLQAALEDDYEVFTAANADEAFRLMDAEVFDVVLTDLRMAGKSGMKVIDRTLKLSQRPIVIMMTAYGSVETAVEAMRRGAFDFVTKPVSLDKVDLLIQRALKSRRTEEENVRLHERLDQRFSFQGLVGHSQALEQVTEQVRQVAPTRATVLVTGETGTGKELIAQMIHQNSPRSRAAFVPVHCAAIPANLLESELFGHEKGAFTGASERRIGRFEAADGGTLFLDEIGEIDVPTQVKLLRFLETRSLERLGSSKPIQVDVRLVCATNRDLAEAVRQGEFREDLFYRLNVVEVRLPALRERVDDIPLLIDHFVGQFAKENDRPAPRFSAQAMERLTAYAWPGNIRELRNFCENMAIMHSGREVSIYDLETRLRGDLHPSEQADQARGGGIAPERRLSREENEKFLLRNALMEARGNRTRAAELMGISRRTLHRKLAQWPELDVRETG